MRNRVRARNGFTIVELLVSMALIIFIMAILSQAFVSATKSFRDLKATGDMAEKLRGVTQLLTNDLAAYHFEGTKRLSDPDFWNNGPPREGFLRIWSGAGGSVLEGTDLDGIPSYLSVMHTLQYTVKLQGNQRQNFFQGFVPAGAPAFFSGVFPARYQDSGAYTSQWAEVALFLVQQPQDSAMGTSGLPPTQLYSLYRRQRLLVPDNSVVVPAVLSTQANSYVELSTSVSPNPLNLYFNSPRDVTMPVRRFGMDPSQGLPGGDAIPPAPPYYTPPGTPSNTPINFPLLAQFNPGPQAQFAAADLLLTDVISFDVRVFVAGNTDFLDVQSLAAQYPNNNSGFGGGQAVFDTWSSATDSNYNYSGWAFPGTPSTIPMWKNTITGLPIQIKAIQVQIRIWDVNTQQTRQVTIVQDM